MASEQFTVNGIVIEVVRKKIKNFHLRVYPPRGEVRVSAPLHVSKKSLESVILARMEWIQQQQARLSQIAAPLITSQFKTGDVHYYQGRPYVLNVIECAGRAKVVLRENFLDLYIRAGADADKRQALLNHWYRQQLALRIPELIAKWQPVIGVTVADWGIKAMKTRWGTCNIGDRRIWLALALAQKPAHCLEYVVVHEMVHLLERTHNHRFQAFMTRFLPDWPKIKQELNGKVD